MRSSRPSSPLQSLPPCAAPLRVWQLPLCASAASAARLLLCSLDRCLLHLAPLRVFLLTLAWFLFRPSAEP